MSADKKESAADRAYAGIRAAIMNGEYAPGTMLSENSLAALLSVSRTPVRAALVRLQEEGWVTIYAQRGALVRDLTLEEVRESAEVRHALETAGVQRSAAGRRAQLGDRMAANIDAQEQALLRGDFPTFATLTLQFHRAFVELADNGTMLAFYDRLHDRQYLSVLRSASRSNDEPQRAIAEHRRLLEDACAGDWIAFATHLTEHQSRTYGLETGLRPASAP